MTKEMEYTDYTPDLYTLVDDNGNESTFEMLDAMEVDDDAEYEKIGAMFMERLEDMFEFEEEDCGCGDADCDCHLS